MTIVMITNLETSTRGKNNAVAKVCELCQCVGFCALVITVVTAEGQEKNVRRCANDNSDDDRKRRS